MRQAIAVDIARCTGCRNCELECSIKHSKSFNPKRSRIQIVRVEKKSVIVPVVCLQCETPLCKEACPVDAIKYNAVNVLAVTENCIGCGKCISACVYGGIAIDPLMQKAIKCDLCNGKPACIEACKYGALSIIRADMMGLKTRLEGIRKSIEIIGLTKEVLH